MFLKSIGDNLVTNYLYSDILPLLILLFIPMICLAEEIHSLEHLIGPIEVSGLNVQAMSGMEASNIRVIASRNGELQPIPFQIDQKGSNDDWVWDVAYESADVDEWLNDESSAQASNHYVLTHDDEDPPGKIVFDDNDVIVFLAKDSGDRDRDSIMKLGADRLVELEVSDPVDESRGWVYLAHFKTDAPAMSSQRYIRYEPENLLVLGPEHEFLYSSNNMMALDDFRLGGDSILTGNRIRGEVKIGIGPIALDFEFSEESIKGYNAGYISGPIRIVKRSIERVQLGSGITSPYVNCDHFHYPWHAEIPILISKRFPVRQLSLHATSIFRESIFNQVVADGIEKPIILGASSVPGNLMIGNIGSKWIELAGDGISVINSVKLPEEHKGHLDISPYLIYTRGTSGAYDIKSVSGVEAGFTIRTTDNTPNGDHVVHSVFLFTASSNRKEYLDSAIKLLQQKLNISAVTLAQ